MHDELNSTRTTPFGAALLDPPAAPPSVPTAVLLAPHVGGSITFTAAAPADVEGEKAKRRVRSSHRGVVLRERAWKGGGRVTYFARWRDPETRRVVDTNLTKLGRTSEDSRRQWAVAKSRTILARAAALASGAPRRTETALGQAVEDYLAACETRLRRSTMQNYRPTTKAFVAWAKRQGVALAEELDRSLLSRYRDVLVASKKRVSVKKGRRGQHAPVDRTRSPASVNHELRHLKACLNKLRLLGILPLIDSDGIADALRSIPGFRPQPRPLSYAACSQILEAALRHDLGTFKMTRKEHGGKPSVLAFHRTPRHDPIAPFVAYVMLTGCRFGEALSIRWDAVDLNAENDYGKAAGEIFIDPSETKTHLGRRIDLSVSPGLRALLTAMKVRAGGKPYVFGRGKSMQRWRADEARKRLCRKYGAPKFSWQQLRQTCASFLTSAPGIFRAASIYRSAEQLGHSAEVAQRHYLNAVRGIPARAKTLESAMKIEAALERIILHARGESVELEPVAVAN
jgi:integrase